jgi:hypothetical protein
MAIIPQSVLKTPRTEEEWRQRIKSPTTTIISGDGTSIGKTGDTSSVPSTQSIDSTGLSEGTPTEPFVKEAESTSTPYQTERERGESLIEGERMDANVMDEELFDEPAPVPVTAEEQADELVERHRRQKFSQDLILSNQSKLAQLQLEGTRRQLTAAEAASSAQLAGREGPQSTGNVLAHVEFKAELDRRMEAAKLQRANFAAQAGAARDALTAAQKTGQQNLIKEMQGNLNRAEAEVQRRDSIELQLLNQQSQLALELGAENRANFTTFTNLANNGNELNTEGLIDMAKQLNLPFDVVNSYYQSVQNIRDDKTLTLEQKEIEKASMADNLDAQLRGVKTQAAQNLDLYLRLKPSLTEEERVNVARALGINIGDDPLVQAEVRIAEAEARIAEINAGAEPVKDSLLWWEREVLKAQINESKAQIRSIDSNIKGDGRPFTDERIGGGQPTEPVVTYDIGDRTVTGQAVFADRVRQADEAMFAATGNHIIINESFRSPERQAAIWADSEQGTKFRAAPPGMSWHERGLAMDIVNWEEATPFLNEVGIVGGLSGDQGHFSMGEMNPEIFSGELVVEKSTALEVAQLIMDPTSAFTIKDVPQDERQAVEAELQVLKNEALAAKDFIGIMAASAGGTKATESFRQSMEKASTVVSQLGVLSNLMLSDSIEVANEEGILQTFDLSPLSGWLAQKNPWDTEAQAITAVLYGTVPNLARGIFGEVGVLTDADIQTYMQTLPNLRQTDDVKRAVTALTMRTVRNSIENKIKIQAGTGIDMSGLIPFYTELDNKIKALEAELGISDEGFIDPYAVEDKYNAEKQVFYDDYLTPTN